MHRRDFFAAAGAGLLGTGAVSAALAQEALATAPPAPGGYESIIAEARALSTRPFEPAVMELTGPFADLGYDTYRAIRPRSIAIGPERHGFAIDLLPPGFLFKEAVKISLVSESGAQEIPFAADLFDFDPDVFKAEQLPPRKLTEGLSFSGFRLRHGINRVDHMDEFAVFQGASYFRAISRNMLYGLSARALAIRTGDPRGEEFPVFKHFWIVRPSHGARSVVVRALMDSPSCAGAFEFDITPGGTTSMQIRCTLFPRETLEDVGLAPLTSMFLFGPQWRTDIDDFRPAVHDSEGLQMITGRSERLWRPLTNPAQVQISAFQDSGPKGFGLVQRRRDFAHYQDDEARYEKRPTGFVEPVDDWGRGAVVLVEIPTRYEFNDNIVAFWRPGEPLAPSEEGHRFAYWLHWGDAPPDSGAVAPVVATRTGRSIHDENQRVIVIDFMTSERGSEPFTVQASVNQQAIPDIPVHKLPDYNLSRVSFHFAPGEEDLLEFHLALIGSEGPVSERWLYRWTSS